MGIFDSLQHYAGKWGVTASRKFDESEKACINEAEVVSSQYGMSVCFFLKTGGQVYIPVSSDSNVAVGQKINVDNAELLTLSRVGDEDITRVKIL